MAQIEEDAHEKQDAAADDTSRDDEGVAPTSEEPVLDTHKAAEDHQTDKKLSKHHPKQYLRAYWHHKRWTLPVTIVALLLLIMAVPFSRYKILGMFLKEPATITVIDSTTDIPVSDARLQLNNTTALTSVHGKATMKVAVGTTALNVSKQYYKKSSTKILVSYDKSHNAFLVHLVATGRQVPVTIINKITGSPISDAEIKVLDTEAKTDKNGKATIVLPVKSATQAGTVVAANYNQASVKVQVTSQVVAANTYSLTPSGSIYFLSNLSGKIDVVKTNLDGTDRQTVLAGTGNESPTDTVLLASRDWKYLALLTQRSATGGPELDLIDTSTGVMSNIDEGNATFTPIGWSGDRFIYTVSRNTVQPWQNGQEALKSFNAPTKSITILAQTSASGSQYDYTGQQFDGVYLVNDQVIYVLNWQSSANYLLSQNNSQTTLNSINNDGSKPTVLKAIGAATGYMYVEPYDGPNTLALQVENNTTNSSSYYEYQNGALTASTDLTDQNFYNNVYATYLQSPSGNQTFWSEPTDGKNTLFVGDKNGNNAVKVAVQSDYTPYGWYTNSYLLVSKNSSELYIMPVSGGTPIPISDYFKPSQFYNNGYGGGYGGL